MGVQEQLAIVSLAEWRAERSRMIGERARCNRPPIDSPGERERRFLMALEPLRDDGH